MWKRIARYILRHKIVLLVILIAITAFMAFQAPKVELSYEYAPLLPKKDAVYQENQEFIKKFGASSDVMVIGIQKDDFFSIDHFSRWVALSKELMTVDGVEGTLSVSNAYDLVKNSEEGKFQLKPIFPDAVQNQEQLDSLVSKLKGLPFYDGQLYNPETNTYLMAITVSKAKMATPKRVEMVESIVEVCEKYSSDTQQELHYSGIPYIRVIQSQKVKNEFSYFTLAALAIVILILFLIFRSFKLVFFPVIVVIIAVVWTVGLMATLGFKITLLTGMIPPLLIVIGIPNCIFLVNKYQAEFRKHGNKVKALQRTIMKIGNATFLSNLTTAAGFATFLITSSDILRQFGLIASVNIMAVFVTSLIIIPTAFSFLAPPKEKDTRHLEDGFINKVTEKLVFITAYHRKYVYTAFTLIVLGSIYGISMMKSTGYMVDDIPEKDPIYVDLKFFESNFHGLMPLEVTIDTRKPNGIMRMSNLAKIEELNEELKPFTDLSPSLSVVNLLKFAKQSFYNGDPQYYNMPSSNELSFIYKYIDQVGNSNSIGEVKSFIDSTKQATRISFRVKDVGTVKMEELLANIKQKTDTIFPADKYTVHITGASVVSLKGTEYLITNLFQSLGLAVLLIALFMALMFNSRRMVLLALVPNLIPLLFTAAIMGYFNIPIKASTILVFSIAFGISVDNTIHFLTKYRQELKLTAWSIGESVQLALREIGVSMIYNSSVLFFGFGIFSFSSFGGTVALGILVSLTLLVALISNLVLLPSLLMWLQRRATTKYFQEPLIEIFDEEVDIEFDNLVIETVPVQEVIVKKPIES